MPACEWLSCRIFSLLWYDLITPVLETVHAPHQHEDASLVGCAYKGDFLSSSATQCQSRDSAATLCQKLRAMRTQAVPGVAGELWPASSSALVTPWAVVQ